MKNGTYNIGVYWPDSIQTLVEHALKRKYKLKGTKHLFERLKKFSLEFSDLYPMLTRGEVVEAEIKSGKLHKVVCRIPHPRNFRVDLCSPIVFEDKTARVITIWCNNSLDFHETVRKSNYVRS